MPSFCPSTLWNGVAYLRLCTVQNIFGTRADVALEKGIENIEEITVLCEIIGEG